VGFLFSRLFWGLILICWGGVLIIEKLFKVNIPMGRFILAFILVYCGIYIITARSCRKSHAPSKAKVVITNTQNDKTNEYSTVFGSSIIDLRAIKDIDKEIDISTVFGTTEIWLSDQYAYNITDDTVFGVTELPPKDTAFYGLGSNTSTIGDPDNANIVSIHINTVFGRSVVEVQKTDRDTAATTDNVENEIPVENNGNRPE